MIKTLKRIYRNVTAPNAYSRQDNPVLWQGLEGSPSLDTALSFSAFWRGVHYLAGVIAALPWEVQTANGDNGAAKRVPNHPVDRLLSVRPNRNSTAMAWRQTMIAHRLVFGAGYSEIQRTVGGDPFALWPIHASRVTPKLTPDRELVFMVAQSDGSTLMMPADSILHFPGLSFDGLTGCSVLHCARRTIEAGVEGDKFATALWKNSAMIGGMLSHPAELSDTAYDRLKQQFQERYVGAQNRGAPMIGEEGLTFTPFSLPPEDAQFLENRHFTIEDFSRWLGVPPHKLMDNRNATYSNVEEQNLEVIGDTIIPMIEAMEQEADYKLLSASPARPLKTQMDISRLARGNFNARAQWLRFGFDTGGVSPNRIAREFGEPPIPGGDERFIQMNLQTVDAAANQTAPVAAPAVAPQIAGEQAPTPDNLHAVCYAHLLAAFESLATVERALVSRYAKGSDEQWGEKTAAFADKASARLAGAVATVCDAYGIAGTLPVEIPHNEARTFINRRVTLDPKKRACTALDVIKHYDQPPGGDDAQE